MWESRPAMPALKYESRAAALQFPHEQASLFRRNSRLKLEVLLPGRKKQGTDDCRGVNWQHTAVQHVYFARVSPARVNRAVG